MTYAEMIDYVSEHMTEAALLEGLIEECAELQQGCAKLARIIRGENPTTVTPETAAQWIAEEMTDVELYIAILGTKGILPADRYWEKLKRWVRRLGGDLSE